MTVKKARSNAGKIQTAVKRAGTGINIPADVAEKESQDVSESVSTTRDDSGNKKESKQGYMPGRRVWPD